MKKILCACLVGIALFSGAVVANAGFSGEKSAKAKAVTTEVKAPNAVSTNSNWYCPGVVVTGKGVRVRTAPSLNGKIIGHAGYMKCYRYLGDTYGWYKISFKGRVGWVSADYSYLDTCD